MRFEFYFILLQLLTYTSSVNLVEKESEVETVYDNWTRGETIELPKVDSKAKSK